MTDDAGAGSDARGTVHERVTDAASLRIVSLVPSLTELLCDLGLAPALVGRTGYCIHPAGLVGAIAKVGGTKTVNVEKIRRLAPTHLVVNVDENEKPTVDALAEFIPHVLVTHPQEPRDNLALYRLMGHVFDRTAEAQALCERFEAAYRALEAARTVGRFAERRVLYLIWKDPWMTIARDTYIATLLACANWRQRDAGAARLGASARYPSIDLALALAEVDLVLLSSEPYAFTARHVVEVETMSLSHAHRPRVRVVDGEMLSWYGSRAIAGLDYLRQIAQQENAYNT